MMTSKIASKISVSLLLSLAVTACGGAPHHKTAAAPPTSVGQIGQPITPSTPPATTATAPPDSHPPPPALQAVATAYLTARENTNSYFQASPESWSSALQQYTTSQEYAILNQPLPPGISVNSGGYVYNIMHMNHWKVNVQAVCFISSEGAQSNTSTQAITCNITDTTVTATGTPVPTAQLPNIWHYQGTATPATLLVINQGGTWKVAKDEST